MSGELQTSSLLREVESIVATAGSPYFRVVAIIKSGGKDIRPHQVLHLTQDEQYRTNYCETITIAVTLGTGTLMNDIGPFQDDLKIMLSLQTCDESGTPYSDVPILIRTYKAYLGDHIPRPSDSGTNQGLKDTETANRTIRNVVFVLEEVAVEQLRKQAFGTVFTNAVPCDAAAATLDNYRKALKLGSDELLTNVDVVTPNNTTPRTHIPVKHGTPVLELPDIMQNEQGGIYSTGLGFFIKNKTIWMWPLYDLSRFDSARNVLRVIMSPSKHGKILDRTWRQVGRVLTFFSAGLSPMQDDTTGNMNISGNATRFSDANKLVEDFGTVTDNKLTLSRTKNNNEYAIAVVGNGENYAVGSDKAFTGNVYHEAAKKARLTGVLAVIPWRRSDPSKLSPGMPVEILYEYGNDIRTIEGIVIGATHSYDLEGSGMQAFRYTCNSSLIIFVDRNDPDYIAYLKGGGTLSTPPEIKPF